MKKILILVCAFLTVMIILSGCAVISAYIPEEDLVISRSQDAVDYLYSNKVLLHLSNHYDDMLELMVDDHPAETVLEDSFIKTAHHDSFLYIKTNEAYYVFDIESYTPPEEPTVMYTTSNGATVVENTELHYILKKYSFSEFSEIYPKQQSFDWEYSENRK